MEKAGWSIKKGLDSQADTVLHSLHERLWSRGQHGGAVLCWKGMHILTCEAKQSRLGSLVVMAVPLGNAALEKPRDACSASP